MGALLNQELSVKGLAERDYSFTVSTLINVANTTNYGIAMAHGVMCFTGSSLCIHLLVSYLFIQFVNS